MNADYMTIAVHVNESPHTLARVKLAARMAVDSGAHLIGVAAVGLPTSFYLAGMMGEGAILLPDYLDMIKERANNALALFDAVADKAGVPSFERRTLPEDPGLALSLHARYNDVLVIGQDDPEDSSTIQSPVISDYVLLNSASPVLVVPREKEFDATGRRVLIAWDGSMEATRAVRGALPILKNAELVEITVFDALKESVIHGEEPGADIALYLARHRVNVNVFHRPHGKFDDIEIANAILSHAGKCEADLLVMGAYGHSRFREVILGGVTRTILKTTNIPVLACH